MASPQPILYYQFSTSNTSFIDLQQFLESKGIVNNKFHLVLFDPDLAGVDPFDPKLNVYMKQKILLECTRNYWYFIREVVRVPVSGSATGVKYKINRGSLALSYCATMNLNMFLEMPRQTGKTIAASCWYLWLFNFGTANSDITFLNKRLDDAKYNLSLVKEIRDLLPSYLQMDSGFNMDGTKAKIRSNVEAMQHPINNNKIRTVASARNTATAASLLRGRTVPLIYMDEWAFVPYNEVIYTNMTPAFVTAANNARMNLKPYGMIITTTPGYLTTDEGVYAFKQREASVEWNEKFYDLTYQQLMELISSNKSNFMHIRYTYKELGKSEEWFKDLVVNMGMDWAAIRREVLLEWAQTSENSPFRKEDLETIKSLTRTPIQSILILNKYVYDIYEKINERDVALMGVDVSGGYNRDSSAITVVSSSTTRVVGTLNCNYISTLDLASVIMELCKMLPRVVINIERNGGFGASVLAKLLKTPLKNSLFYTIKDKVIEERFNGPTVHRRTQKTKVYGSDSTKDERDTLMEIMRDRVEYHKDKIVAPIIYDELKGLEVKKSGKIEHSSNTHDDQIFSWLWALYIYYEGTDLMNNWGIEKHVLKTDADLEEAVYDLHQDETNVMEDVDMDDNEEFESQMQQLVTPAGSMSYEEWLQSEEQKDKEAMDKIIQTKPGREAYARQFNVDPEYIQQDKFTTIPDSVFSTDLEDDGETFNENGELYNGLDSKNPYAATMSFKEKFYNQFVYNRYNKPNKF